MKIRFLVSCVGLVLLAATAGFQGCTTDDGKQTAPFEDLTRWVDPAIGSQGDGNVVPGPCHPHGMVKLSPDTNAAVGSIDAYEWSNDRIEAFSHTHLQGPGGSNNGYSQIGVKAFTGEVPERLEGITSAFTHDDEIIEVGYYAVTLQDWDVRAELTATPLTGIHRYTFPAGDHSRILFDLRHTRGQALDGHAEFTADGVVEGYGVYQVNPLVAFPLELTDPGTGIATVYFSGRFSKVPDATDVVPSGDSVGAIATFTTSDREVIEVRVGISYVSVQQARMNREAEAEVRTFDEAREDAVAAWNLYLNRIAVEGGTDDDRVMFYTALYHSLMVPADTTETGDVFWNGSDRVGKVFKDAGWRHFSDNWCTWDTARTTHPLMTIVAPELVDDNAQSFVLTYEQGGWMAKATWNATGDSRCMTANFQYCIVSDAFQKGFRGFDGETAYEAMRKGSLEDSTNLMQDTHCGYLNQGTPPDYVDSGWVPKECDGDQSGSMTLEYAYNDACVARMAELLGREDDATFFRERSGNYRNVWNPQHGFMQERWRDGTWVEPFDPTHWRGFTESDSWKYTWFVPHDQCGLVELMGGRDAFVAKLDQFFDEGHFTPDNEPDFHTPYLYAFVGEAGKTQQRVRQVMDTAFSTAPNGLPGNDDAGATSAWYVFSALGFYPVNTGADDLYWMGSPVFERAAIRLDPVRQSEGEFVVEAEGASATNRFIQSATLNGKPLEVPYITHGQIVAGGTLALVMGPEPSSWGSNTCN